MLSKPVKSNHYTDSLGYFRRILSGIETAENKAVISIESSITTAQAMNENAHHSIYVLLLQFVPENQYNNIMVHTHECKSQVIC